MARYKCNFLKNFEKCMKEAHRENLKKSVSEMFNQMGLRDASKGVLKAKTKKQFKYYLTIARGWFAYHDGKERYKKAIKLLNKLEREY